MRSLKTPAAAIVLAAAVLLAASSASASQIESRSGLKHESQTISSPSGSQQHVLVASQSNNGGAGHGTPVVPIPAAAWLFTSGLIGMAGIGFRRQAK